MNEPGENDTSALQGPAVSNQVSGGSLGLSVQAGTIHGGVHVHQPVPPGEVPRQLPGVPVHFTNRAAEIRALDEAVTRRDERALRSLAVFGQGYDRLVQTARLLSAANPRKIDCPIILDYDGLARLYEEQMQLEPWR
jgi:hypothetical protein